MTEKVKDFLFDDLAPDQTGQADAARRDAEQERAADLERYRAPYESGGPVIDMTE